MKIKRLLRIFPLLLLFYFAVAFLWAWHVTTVAVERVLENSPQALGKTPKEFIPIVLQVEDPSFFRHPGLDPFTEGQGLTTLTQALNKDASAV